MPKLARNLFTFRHIAKKKPYKYSRIGRFFKKFERIIANEWRKNQKFHFNENTTGFRPQVIRVRNQLPITRTLYSEPQVHQ